MIEEPKYTHQGPSEFYLMRKRRDAIDDPQELAEHLEEVIIEKDDKIKHLENWIIELGQKYYKEKEKHSYER